MREWLGGWVRYRSLLLICAKRDILVSVPEVVVSCPDWHSKIVHSFSKRATCGEHVDSREDRKRKRLAPFLLKQL